jgi:hypothetical protein
VEQGQERTAGVLRFAQDDGVKLTTATAAAAKAMAKAMAKATAKADSLRE